MTRRRLLPILVAVVAGAVAVAIVASQALGERAEVGLVVDVESTGLVDVQAFTLRTGDGRETVYRIGELDNATDFPPSHLREHIATAKPVRVTYREIGGDRVAHRIEDAPEP